MKMKKRMLAILASVTVLGAVAFTACGGGNGGGGTPAPNYTVTVVDQDGDAVKGAALTLTKGEISYTLTTDDSGKATIEQGVAGEYSVTYTQLPSDFYDVNPETAGIPVTTSVTFSENVTEATLTVSNWTMGTSLAPYTCYYETDEETGEVSATMYVPTVLANSDNYYLVSKSGDRVICIGQADVTVVYKGVTYNAKDGAIEVQSQAPTAGDLNYWACLQIINETDEDIELVMTFKEAAVEEPQE